MATKLVCIAGRTFQILLRLFGRRQLLVMAEKKFLIGVFQVI